MYPHCARSCFSLSTTAGAARIRRISRDRSTGSRSRHTAGAAVTATANRNNMSRNCTRRHQQRIDHHPQQWPHPPPAVSRTGRQPQAAQAASRSRSRSRSHGGPSRNRSHHPPRQEQQPQLPPAPGWNTQSPQKPHSLQAGRSMQPQKPASEAGAASRILLRCVGRSDLCACGT